MRRLRTVLARIHGLFADRRADDELREELAAHLEMQTAENIRRGMAPAAAHQQASRASGGMTFAVEAVREQRSLPWIESVVTDLRYAIRALRRSAAFTGVAVTTLALGIGANTAVFSVVNGILLRPLEYREPERLISLTSVINGTSNAVSARDFTDWRVQARSFAGLAAGTTSETVLTGAGEPERLSQARVTANALDVLSIHPITGRAFLAGEDEVSAPRVAMLSERFWRRRFGGDPGIVGRNLLLDGMPTQVVGIAPAQLRWPDAADVWLTTRFTPSDLSDAARGKRWIAVVGRLSPGVSLQAARTELDVIARRLAQLDPNHNANVGTQLTPLLESMVGEVQTPLLILVGAVGFVLLIACANVASLTLGRIGARDVELALRTALGAARGRIVRQMFTESLLLAFIGGAVGLLLAYGGTRALVAIAPPDLPRLGDVHLDARVLAFTFALTLLTGALFGVIPALQGASANLHHRLQSGGRGTVSRRGGTRSRRTLVVAEVALAMVLLAGAGLLIRSFAQLRNIDPGFRPEHVTTFGIPLPQTRYGELAQQRQVTASLLDAVRRVPGVTAAAVSFGLPLSGNTMQLTFDVAGRPQPDATNEPRAQVRVASAEYFRAMGIPLVRGRTFDVRDRADAPQVLVISSEVARRYFPGEDPIGRYIGTGWGQEGRKFGGQVIGVVGDVTQFTLDRGATPHLYMAYDQWPLNEYDIVVRSTATPAAVFSAIRPLVRQIDADIPINDLRPLTEIVDASLGQRQFYLMLLGVFAAVAVLLASVGIYGVIAYGVQLRRREIGIRLALGATRGGVLAMVLSEGLRLASSGIVIGIVAALALTRLLESLLFEVGARDPVTFVAAPAALAVVAVLACWLPAHRAAIMNPVETIRIE